MRILVVGKGGTGKSMISATVARLLARRGHRVAAVDADHLPGLSISLGMGIVDSSMLAPAMQADQGSQWGWRLPRGVGPARAIRRYSLEGPDGIRLLQFGKAGKEGVTEDLRKSLLGLDQVVRGLKRSDSLRGWSVVADFPAGTWLAAGRWRKFADTVLLVVTPAWPSILTARRLARILRSDGRRVVIPIANLIDSREQTRQIEARLGERVCVAIPRDIAVVQAERQGIAFLDADPDAPAIRSLARLVDQLEAHPDRSCGGPAGTTGMTCRV